MMRRRLIRPRPVVGMVARTAVVAGTAAVTAGAVQHHQQQKYANQAAEQVEQDQAVQNQAEIEQMQQQMAAMQAQQAQAALPPQPAPAAAASVGGTDVTSRLKELSDLKAAGVLTDEEFAAAKAKVLSGG
jgi:hypothetical protein